MQLERLIEYLGDSEQTHHQSGRGDAALKLPEAEGQAGNAADGVDADRADEQAEHCAEQALDQRVGAHGNDDRQTHEGDSEILPAAEAQRNLRELRCDCHQRKGGERTADEGTENADCKRLSRLALLRHRIAVKAGVDGRRGTGDVDEGCGDKTAADAADIDGNQHDEALYGLHGIGERNKQCNAEGGGQTGDTAEDNADEYAQREKRDTHRVTEYILETKENSLHKFPSFLIREIQCVACI